MKEMFRKPPHLRWLNPISGVKNAIATILFCFTLSFAAPAVIFAQPKESSFKDRRVTLRFDGVPFGSVLAYLIVTYGVPIGFEESISDRDNSIRKFSINPPGISPFKLENNDGVFRVASIDRHLAPKHPITIDIQNERLETALDLVIKQMDNYRWDVLGGVVNVTPTRERYLVFEKLLDVKISRFHLDKRQTVGAITTTLKALPEFSRFLKQNNLRFTGGRNGPEAELKDEYNRVIDQEMDFSNLSFRDLLNKISKIKDGGWVLRWKGVSVKTGEEIIDLDI